jgi:hypothetical protein
VFPHLVSPLRGFYGLVHLIDQIRCGTVYCFAVHERNDAFGMVWGHEYEPHVLCCHHAFTRHRNVGEALKMVTAKCLKETGFYRFVGFIPDTYRASKLMAIRAGCRDIGMRPDMVFVDATGNNIPCREFRKG